MFLFVVVVVDVAVVVNFFSLSASIFDPAFKIDAEVICALKKVKKKKRSLSTFYGGYLFKNGLIRACGLISG